jgi:hypothetical protein
LGKSDIRDAGDLYSFEPQPVIQPKHQQIALLRRAPRDLPRGCVDLSEQNVTFQLARVVL